MDNRSNEIALGQTINLAHSEYLYLRRLGHCTDENDFKELIKKYYEIIIEAKKKLL